MPAIDNPHTAAGHGEVTVCIDSYENKVPVGTAHFGFKRTAFNGAVELIQKIDGHLDKTGFPEPYVLQKTFGRPGGRIETVPAEIGSFSQDQGRLATFFIKVLFRQNASWQGSILWKEGRNEASFRSVLELIGLMDSALER